jgi:2-octaprenyl-6-methoxyphenol hydroxylase
VTEQYDLAVIGGGPVGAALALEAARRRLRVLVLEARHADARSGENRPLALSYGSRLLLEHIRIWDQLAPATPIRRIHVSQRGGIGRTEMTAAEARLPALGYMVDYTGLLLRLEAALEQTSVSVTRGARVTSIAHDAASARVEFERENSFHDAIAAVVALADGGAAALDVGVRTRDYDQVAITARVTTARPHKNTAFERFTPEGPIALLPYEHNYALVWTLAPARGESLYSASSGAFLAALRTAFGERVGAFLEVGERHLHRLTLRVSERATIGRMALVGNASQSLHPVAGQGFNLGLRDAWELAAELARRGAGSPEVLSAYGKRRRIDRAAGIAFTDLLVNIFSNDNAALRAMRGIGLTALGCVPPAKDFLVRRMVFGARA